MRAARLGVVGSVGALVATIACGGGGSGASGGPDGGADTAGGSSGGSGGSSGGSTSSSSSGGASSSSGTGSSSGSGSSGSSGGGAPDGGDGGALQTGKICAAVPPGDYETYSLPPTSPLPAGVSALTDWAAHPEHGGWYGAQQMDACRYQADPSGFQTWHGKRAARVEVDPGDDPLQLGENSERTECLDEQDATGMQWSEGPSSGTVYYATSYYFPTTWAATSYPYSVFESGGSTWPGNVSSDCGSAGNLCNSWSLVLQFHGPGGGTPWAVLSAASKAPGQPQTMWLSGSMDVAFSDGGGLTPGAWLDLVLEVDWATPTISVWRRDEGKTAFTQVVAAAAFPAAASGTYMKQGLYRGGNVNGRTDVLWVGPTARGASFAAVEQAAFGTAVGP